MIKAICFVIILACTIVNIIVIIRSNKSIRENEKKLDELEKQMEAEHE